jgi:hypothetical protein
MAQSCASAQDSRRFARFLATIVQVFHEPFMLPGYEISDVLFFSDTRRR